MMLDAKMIVNIMNNIVPYIDIKQTEEYIKSVLRDFGFTLQPSKDREGVVLSSGIYHIYKAGTRHQDYETIIGKLFEMYGMSRELYTDLAAKLIVLRTLTHTLSVLAAVVPDRSGIYQIADVIKRETGIKDLILAVYDEKIHLIYFPNYFSENTVKKLIEQSMYSGSEKRYIGNYMVHPHSYATDDGIFFIGLVLDREEPIRVEPELLSLLLYILIPFLRSVYLSEISSYDALTGILSRRKLMDSLKMLWNLSKYTDSMVGVLMCDIDHFKRFNDTYGHDVGDIVLKEVARIIKQTAPRGSVVGRYGGEEFVVAMNITSTSQLKRFAEAIRLAVSENTISANDTVLHITISIGGAVGNCKKIDDIMTLLKQADENLYEAKENGRNRSIVK